MSGHEPEKGQTEEEEAERKNIGDLVVELTDCCTRFVTQHRPYSGDRTFIGVLRLDVFAFDERNAQLITATLFAMVFGTLVVAARCTDWL